MVPLAYIPLPRWKSCSQTSWHITVRGFDQGQPRIVLSTDKPETGYLGSFHTTRSPKQAPLQPIFRNTELLPWCRTQFFSESKELKSSAPPSYCSLLFGSQRILSVFVTSAAKNFCSPGCPNSGTWRCTSACGCCPISRCGVLSRINAHLRWFEKDLKSEIVFWSVNGQLNLAITGLNVATSFSSCSQLLSNIFAPSANPYQLVSKLVHHVEILLV